MGGSLGLDRLVAALEELNMIEKVGTPAKVFLPFFAENRLADYLEIAAKLRSQGIGVELFCEPKKLGQQLKYADKRGYVYAVIVGENEFETQTCQIKDLRDGSTVECALSDVDAVLSRNF